MSAEKKRRVSEAIAVLEGLQAVETDRETLEEAAREALRVSKLLLSRSRVEPVAGEGLELKVDVPAEYAEHRAGIAGYAEAAARGVEVKLLQLSYEFEPKTEGGGIVKPPREEDMDYADYTDTYTGACTIGGVPVTMSFTGASEAQCECMYSDVTYEDKSLLGCAAGDMEFVLDFGRKAGIVPEDAAGREPALVVAQFVRDALRPFLTHAWEKPYQKRVARFVKREGGDQETHIIERDICGVEFR